MKTSSIHRQLQQYIRLHYKREWIKHFFVFVFFFSLLLIFSGLLEMAFWLKPQFKIILLIINLLLFVYLTGRHLVFPGLQYFGYFRDLTPEIVARQLGKRVPALSDRLVNFLELEKLQGYDLDLLQAELKRREAQLQKFQWDHWLPRVRFMNYLYWLFVPVFIVALLKVSGRYSDFTRSFERLQAVNRVFQPPAPFRLSVLSPLQTVADSVYTLKVAVIGETLPEQIQFVTSGNPLPLNKINDTLFFLNLADLSQNIDFQLIASGYVFGPYHLTLIYPPSVSHYQIRLKYPAYTRFKGDTVTGSSFLKIPEGTRVNLKAQTIHTQRVIAPSHIDFQFKPPVLHSRFIARKSGRLVFQLYNNQYPRPSAFELQVEVIPDRKPLLEVIRKSDSSMVSRKHFLLVNASDDYLLSRLELHYKTPGEAKFHKKMVRARIRMPYLKTVLVFPGDFHLPDTSGYAYFFRIYDNKTPVPQYTDSPVFQYAPAISGKMQSEKVQRQFLANLQGNVKKFQRQNKSVSNALQKLQTTRQSDWETKREINRLNQNYQQENLHLRRLLDEMNRMMKKYQNKAHDKKKAEMISKRMEELRKSLQNDSLSRELQKLLEQMRKLQMLDKLKEMQSKQEMQQKSLERLLELTKRFFIEEKINMLADTLNRLAKRQTELSKTQKPGEKQLQQQINQATDSLSKSFEELKQMNKTLKSPVAIPDIQTELKTARMFQKNAMQQMENGKQSNEMQRKAGDQLSKAAMMLQSMMNQSAQEMHKEDLKKIKTLIYNLLQVSFEEEKIGQIRLNNNYAYSGALVKHNTLINVLQNVSDTLYAIASRQPAIGQDMFDALHSAEFHAEQSVKYLQDRNVGMFQLHERSLFEQVNRLIYLLNLFLDAQQNASLSKSKGQGQGNEPQLSDKIKKQSGKISRSMQDLLKQMQQQGQKQGQKNQNGKQNPKGVFSIYKEQQRLKDLMRAFENQNPSPKIQRLNEQLDKLSDRLLREGLNNSIYKEFLQLQYELLQLTEAAYRQKTSEQRQSKAGKDRYQIPDTLRLQMIRQYFPQLEEIRYYDFPLKPYYKEKYQNYKQLKP